MAWQTTEPTLPAGSSYQSVGKQTESGDHFGFVARVYVARLAGNNVSIHCKLTGNWRDTDYYPQTYYLRRGSDYSYPTWPKSNNDTVHRYWVGELLPGKSKTVKIAASANGSTYISGSLHTFTVYGPDPLIIDKPIYANDNNAIHKTKEIFFNNQGDVLKPKIFVNVGGEIIEIK